MLTDADTLIVKRGLPDLVRERLPSPPFGRDCLPKRDHVPAIGPVLEGVLITAWRAGA